MNAIAAASDVRYDLIFGDPPFNIGVEYAGDGCDDRRDCDQYNQWTIDWMRAAASMLTPCGRLVVHVPDDLVFTVQLAAREISLTRDEWIVWHYRFGQHEKKRFINSKCHELVYLFDRSEAIWNPDAVQVQTDRARVYKDSRTDSRSEKENQKALTSAGMRQPFDVWGADVDTFGPGELVGDGQFWGRVPGNSKERRSLHHNQLPELLLQRHVLAYTNPDSWFHDPFCGSGTSIVVGSTLGRNCSTSDQSLEYCESAKQRLIQGAVRIACKSNLTVCG